MAGKVCNFWDLRHNFIMSRPQFFIIASVVIFVVERVLPMLVFWPVFIFPVFAILFMLTSRNDFHDLLYVIAASIFFDFFSGLTLGFMTLAILVVCLSIFLAKKFISIDGHSAISTFAFGLIFTAEYILLFSFGSSIGAILQNWLFILIETTILSIVFIFLFRRVKI